MVIITNESLVLKESLERAHQENGKLRHSITLATFGARIAPPQQRGPPASPIRNFRPPGDTHGERGPSPAMENHGAPPPTQPALWAATSPATSPSQPGFGVARHRHRVPEAPAASREGTSGLPGGKVEAALGAGTPEGRGKEEARLECLWEQEP